LKKSFLISKSFVKDKSVPVVYPQGLWVTIFKHVLKKYQKNPCFKRRTAK
jgi:hypothetical protein